MNGDRIFQCEPCLHYMERDREAILRKNHVVQLMSRRGNRVVNLQDDHQLQDGNDREQQNEV